MITKFQIRAALGGLNLTMKDLADAIGVKRNTISIFLNGNGGMQSRNRDAIQTYLDSQGIEFTKSGGIEPKDKT